MVKTGKTAVFADQNRINSGLILHRGSLDRSV